MSSPNFFCKHKNIFGKEGEGVHSVRVLNIAILDVVGTLLGCWAIAFALNIPLLSYQFLGIVICAFLLAIILHRIFCVNTTVNKLIFGVV